MTAAAGAEKAAGCLFFSVSFHKLIFSSIHAKCLKEKEKIHTKEIHVRFLQQEIKGKKKKRAMQCPTHYQFGWRPDRSIGRST